MTRAEVLDEAKKCICGQREDDYGKPEDNFQVIADLWNVYLTNLMKTKTLPFKLSASDIAMMMTLFKIGRITSGTATADSFVDACGYLACGGEIAIIDKPIIPSSYRREEDVT